MVYGKGRLEAFSDGVPAIVITIMVLEMNVPQGNSLSSLRPLLPVVLYGMVLLVAAIIYYFLAHLLVESDGKNSTLAQAFGKDRKGIVSPILYAAGIGLGFINPWLGFAIYALVAAISFIPDKRIEKNWLVIRQKKKYNYQSS